MGDWHLYLIRTRDGSLYAGITTDVERRFEEHRTLGDRCARFLRGKAPLRLVFSRRMGSRSLALQAETRIKRLPKRAKEEIVRSRPSSRRLRARLALQVPRREEPGQERERRAEA